MKSSIAEMTSQARSESERTRVDGARRVLMISPHFPPDTSAATHRVRLLAPHLPAFGWEPTVLTVEAKAYYGRIDPDIERLVPRDLRIVRAPASSVKAVGKLRITD